MVRTQTLASVDAGRDVAKAGTEAEQQDQEKVASKARIDMRRRKK